MLLGQYALVANENMSLSVIFAMFFFTLMHIDTNFPKALLAIFKCNFCFLDFSNFLAEIMSTCKALGRKKEKRKFASL